MIFASVAVASYVVVKVVTRPKKDKEEDEVAGGDTGGLNLFKNKFSDIISKAKNHESVKQIVAAMQKNLNDYSAKVNSNLKLKADGLFGQQTYNSLVRIIPSNEVDEFLSRVGSMTKEEVTKGILDYNVRVSLRSTDWAKTF